MGDRTTWKASLAAALPILTLLLAAQTAGGSEPDARSSASHDVDEIRVVGARLSRPVSDVVGNVSVVTRDQLMADVTHDVHDLVRYLPGVSINQPDSRFGGTEFAIRGLGGNRVVLLIDGVPVADQFSIGSYSNAGQDYFIADAVSRVELLRGPASTLFGTDALGGVVALITRDPDELLLGSTRHASGSTTYSGADDSITVSVALAGRIGQTSAMLYASQLNGSERRPASGLRDPQDRTRSSALGKLHYRFDNGDLVRAKFELFDDDVATDVRTILGYGRFASTTALAGDDRRRRRSLTLGYEFDRDLQFANRGALNLFVQRTDVDQHTDERRVTTAATLDLWRRFEYQFESIGTTLDFERDFAAWGSDQRLGWGFSAIHADIDQMRDGTQINATTGAVTKTILGETFPVRDFPRSQTTKLAAYLHHEVRTGDFTVIPALRFEAHRLRADADPIFREANPATEPTDLDEAAFAPKIGLIWAPSDSVSWYAQYARGFRAPPFQDVNIGFELPQFNYRGLPNPDLDSETSDGIEVGLRMRRQAWQADIVLFGADYNDLIESRVNLGPDPVTGVLLFQSRNVARARIYGTELSARAWLDDWLPGLELHTVAAWTRGENRITGQPLNSVDPLEVVTRLYWQRGPELRLGLHVTAIASPNRVDQTRTALFVPSGYGLVDVTATWQLSDRVRVDAGVFNLFDREYWRWASARQRPAGDPTLDALMAPGRHISAALRLAL